MPLEPAVVNIPDLNPAWPLGADPASISDDNHRNIKTALRNAFAGFTGAVQVTGVDGGTLNTYTLTPATTLPAYGTKMIAVFAPVSANTGPCTLNISGLGAKALVSVSGDPLVAGDLIIGGVYAAFYDGTQFRLTSVTKNYSDQLVFGATLPAQPGKDTKALRTVGGAAIWDNARLYNSVRTANVVLGDADGGRLIDFPSGNFTQTFSNAAILGEGWWVRLRNSSTTDDIEVESPAAVSTTSSTSNSIAAATIWTVPTGLAITAGDLVILRRTADPFNQRIIGAVASYVSGTGVLTITATYRIGSGTYTDWTITTRPAANGIDGKAAYVMYPGECRDFTMRSGALTSIWLSSFMKEFLSAATFIKPPGYRRFAGDVDSGGASGGRSGNASRAIGGPGGGRFPFNLSAAVFQEATPIVIGAGGAAFTGTSAFGTPGGNSSLGAIIIVNGASSTIGGAIASAQGVTLGSCAGFDSSTGGTLSRPSLYGGTSAPSDGSGNTANSVFGGPGGGSADDSGNIFAPGSNSLGAVGGVAVSASSGLAGTGYSAGGGATRTGVQSGPGMPGKITIAGA